MYHAIITSGGFFSWSFYCTTADLSALLNVFFVREQFWEESCIIFKCNVLPDHGVLFTSVCYISSISSNAAGASKSFLNINGAVTTCLAEQR